MAKQNVYNFADDILKLIFMYKYYCDPIQIALGFVPKSPINNKPALV